MSARSGFSLLEVIVALAIVGAVAVASLAALSQRVRLSAAAREQLIASELAELYAMRAVLDVESGREPRAAASPVSGGPGVPLHFRVDVAHDDRDPCRAALVVAVETPGARGTRRVPVPPPPATDCARRIHAHRADGRDRSRRRRRYARPRDHRSGRHAT